MTLAYDIVTWTGEYLAVPLQVKCEIHFEDGYVDILHIAAEDSKVNIINLFTSKDLEELDHLIYWSFKENGSGL